MKSAYLIRVPEGTEMGALPGPVQEVLRQVQASWPETPVQGLRPANGYEIRLILAAVTLAEAEHLINEFTLDWTIVAAQEPMRRRQPRTRRRANPTTLLPHMPRVPTQWDADGNVTQTRPPTPADLRGGVVLHRYAGWPAWTLMATQLAVSP